MLSNHVKYSGKRTTNLSAGLRVVSVRSGCYGCRISRSDRWTWHGRRDIENNAKDPREARHEVQAEHQGCER